MRIDVILRHAFWLFFWCKTNLSTKSRLNLKIKTMSVLEPENEQEGLPPFIKTWPQMYAIVIGTLFVLMLLFYAMMRYFAWTIPIHPNFNH